MAKHLVLVGAGHAHLPIIFSAGNFTQAGHHVTLISPSPFLYYSGMGPGLFSGRYSPQQSRFHVKKMAEDRRANVVIDSVVRVHADQRTLVTASGEEIAYDIVSFNVGSQVPSEQVGEAEQNIFPVKPIENLLQARRRLLQWKEQELRLLVAGGGPAGFEIACNLSVLCPKEGLKARITLVAGNALLPQLPEKGLRIANQVLGEHRIRLLEGPFVTRIEQAHAHLDSGESLPFDMLFLAVGIRPSPLFRTSNLATGADGGLLVNRFLQSVEYPSIFGAGDCIFFEPRPLDKVGVYAVREGPVLQDNLMAALEGRELKPFRPQKNYLLIFNLGGGRGLFWRKNWIWDGRSAFSLKEYLDKRFMKRYQVSGELEE
jgi:NADH dehydrogenase FAD-containing subunit